MFPPQPKELWRLGKLLLYNKSNSCFTHFCMWLFNSTSNRKLGLSCRFLKKVAETKCCNYSNNHLQAPPPKFPYFWKVWPPDELFWGKIMVLELNLDRCPCSGVPSKVHSPWGIALEPQHKRRLHYIHLADVFLQRDFGTYILVGSKLGFSAFLKDATTCRQEELRYGPTNNQ